MILIGKRRAAHRRARDTRRLARRAGAGVAVVLAGVASAAAGGAFSTSSSPPVAGSSHGAGAGGRSEGSTLGASGRAGAHALVAGSGRRPTSLPSSARSKATPTHGSPTHGSPTTLAGPGSAAGAPAQGSAAVTRPSPSGTTAAVPTTASAHDTVPQATAVPATVLPPGDVLVEVLNGTGTPGQAATVAAELHRAGFAVNGTGNASSFHNPVTVLDYGPGGEPAAQSLASHLVGAAQLRADSAVPPGEVDLVTGASFGGVS